ncbi:hypothetical protein SDC9_59670 [bioreactor metagenome]|uniref:Uncharacterized protein n=1 Tax=bioreactor metagenome TaxID=1076179 RepID=A0A644XGT4_9ZZZZ
MSATMSVTSMFGKLAVVDDAAGTSTSLILVDVGCVPHVTVSSSQSVVILFM